jgi:hypothetical protein
MRTEMGVGEYVFGSSLGILRSENGTPNTTFVLSPQLIDVCEDGTTLIGNGFATVISTSCACVSSSEIQALEMGGVNALISAGFKAKIDGLFEG